MTNRCTYPGCGSYALNIAPKSGLCDVHLYKAQRDDLLEVLQCAVGGYAWPGLWLIDARAAISKATGGTT